MPRWAKILFIGLGAAIMLFSIWWFVYGSMRTSAAQEWPVAQGRVVANRVDASESTDSDGDSTTHYDAVVTFEYPVGGRRYRSERLFLNDHELFNSDAEARAFLYEYRPGTELEVYYNPDDPADAAVFIDGPTWLIFLVTLMGAAFVAAGFLFPADLRRRRPGRTA